MLVLSRRIGEKIVIGDNITIVVNRVSGNRVSLGIDAPANVAIVRGELEDIVKAFDPEFEEDDRPAAQPSSAHLLDGEYLSAM